MSQNDAPKFEIDKIDRLLSQGDALIKAGQMSAAVALISKLNLTQIPRSRKQSMAKLFRRAGLIKHGLRLLYPLIRQDYKFDPPSPEEICEYAVLISRIGSINESLELLKDIDPLKFPEALLYSGFSHMSNWNYSVALKYFEQYLALNRDEYSRLIASVNLSSCYIGSGLYSLAAIKIEESLQQTRKLNLSRLQGNLLELRGQLNVLLFNFKSAKQDLKSAEDIFKGSMTYDGLLTNKWLSIMAGFESHSILPILEFKAKAIQQQHWESVRESDLFSLRIAFDQKTFDQLIYGTPSLAYQRRVQELVSGTVSQKFIFGDPKAKQIFDLSSLTNKDLKGISDGKKMHQMAKSLMNDLYAPRGVAGLFAEVYPGEYFNIDSSPYRIRQIIKRMRRWFEAYDISAEIKFENSGYRLIAHSNCGFSIDQSFSNSSLAIDELYFYKLKKAFAGAHFTTQVACRVLDISESSFHRFVHDAVDKGIINKVGKARSTVYKVA